MISDSHKFVYIHIPKTGGDSISMGLKHVCNNRIVERSGKIPGEIDLRVYYKGEHRGMKHTALKKLPKHTKNYRKVISVRNPFDRVLSWHLWGSKGEFNEEKFIQRITGCTMQINYFDNLDNIDYVIRFENIQEDYQRVCKELGVKPLKQLPRLNSSGRKKHYRHFYTKKTRRLVRKRFEQELSLFNYTF